MTKGQTTMEETTEVDANGSAKRARRGKANEPMAQGASLEELREELRGLRSQLAELVALAAAYGANATAARVQTGSVLAEISANITKLETLGQAQARALALMQRAVAMQLEIDAARMQAEQGGNDGG